MKTLINISDFNEIVNGIKAMKADLVCVYGNCLVGTDNTMTSLKTYMMNKTIVVEPFTIITKELSSEFYANITDTNIIIDTDEYKIYCPNNKRYADTKNPVINPFVTENILQMFYRLNDNISRSKVIELGDITNDEEFQTIKAMKAASGSKLYTPKNEVYKMYLYNNAVPTVKNDVVYLTIFDCNDNTFIGNFRVQRKKINPINIYYRFIKLG